MNNIKICPMSLALSLGIIWAITVFYLTFIDNERKPLLIVESLQQIYFGANPKTAIGKIVLTISAFFDLFICGLILGYLYNYFLQKK